MGRSFKLGQRLKALDVARRHRARLLMVASDMLCERVSSRPGEDEPIQAMCVPGNATKECHGGHGATVPRERARDIRPSSGDGSRAIAFSAAGRNDKMVVVGCWTILSSAQRRTHTVGPTDQEPPQDVMILAGGLGHHMTPPSFQCPPNGKRAPH